MKKKVKEKSWLRDVIAVGIYRLMLGLNSIDAVPRTTLPCCLNAHNELVQ